MSTIKALSVNGLQVKISGKSLLDRVSFSLPPASKVALVGLNGAGKSTLLSALTGKIRLHAGKVRFAELSPQDLAFKALLGVQQANMQPLKGMTVTDYLKFCWHIKSRSAKNWENALQVLVERWGLGPIQNQLMTKLSQGNLQRVAIAQAFLPQNQFIFLDEPTQALDPFEQARFVKNVEDLSSFSLCLFSSHHINEAVAAADHVIMLHHGKLICLLNLKSEYQEWLLIDNNRATEIESIWRDSGMQLEFAGHRRSLYKLAADGDNQFEINQLKSNAQTNQYPVEWLGKASTAIMPLFSALANEAV
ncbi:ATP-binding cassette domain-containing protein [Aliikangiella sp. G2MR2-5]|uniref:ATP-binding cassette domain-containing protein n=1 Tax=Aliikangiella sp. G2MR2-5 TaxID=2788943 RepID=UPI0018A95AE6|nr:ABC transporter ATP-binding protein [Aliikangiella sp. G2MR2-5]